MMGSWFIKALFPDQILQGEGQDNYSFYEKKVSLSKTFILISADTLSHDCKC